MKRLLWIGCLALLVVAAGHLWRTRVNAQGEIAVAIVPSETGLFLNGVSSAQISVTIANAVEIVGFDVVVHYDETLLSLDGWAVGNFLTSPHCFVPVKIPGRIQVVCTQLSMAPGGEIGILFSLNFSGISPGCSAIEIQKAELTNLNYQLILADKVNGSANVTYHTALITGAVFLQGRASPAGILSSLGIGTTYGQGPFSALSAATIGQNLGLGAVVGNDAYTLMVSHPGYLGVATNLAVPVGDDLSLPPLRLLAGDINADDAVDTADLDAIGAAFDAAGSGLAADLNGDGVVNLQDLALAAGNYGLTPAEAYGDWLP